MPSLVAHFQFALSLSAFAALTEALFGYPQFCFRIVSHPIVWMGKLITLCDERLNTPNTSPLLLRLKGSIALIIVLVVTEACTFLIETGCYFFLPSLLAFVVCMLVASSCIAARSLYKHVYQVACSLEKEGLTEARQALSHIVGRDTATLDEPAVLRAAMESLAENFSDGVTAPLFWGCIGGLSGMALYKAINTADSMIGHLNDKYRYFGWAAARMDDVVNLPASRLTALWIIAVAAFSPTLSARRAWFVLRTQASLHHSPNAGWSEAALAGALGVRLAGPRTYKGQVTSIAWMGKGLPDPTLRDLYRALAVFRQACMLQVLFLFFLACFLRIIF